MTTKIRSTKKKLAASFVLVIFIVIFVLGTTFFITKFIRSNSMDKRIVVTAIQNLDKGEVLLEQFKRMPRNSLEQYENSGKTGKGDRQFLPDGGSRPNINYIHFDSNYDIVSLSIRGDITDKLIEQILNNDNYYTGKNTNNFYIQKAQVSDDGTVIFLGNLRYSLEDFGSDMLLFLIINIIFSFVIYLIGKIFIHKAFIPVEQNLDDMKNFVHNAGHELKTPISVIDSNLQLFQEMKVYDEQMAIEMKSEIKKLNSLIDSLVKLSDIDNLKSKDSILLKDILEEIISDFGPKIEEKNINININIDGEKIIKAHKDYLYIFLANIIGNAIKYNKKGGKIDINLKMNSLSIQDTGIGINEKNINKIFDRFFKDDISRTSEGFGIGLSLVKKIADIYNWKILVSSQKDVGTTFSIHF